jgi:hypothetical protein
LNVLLRRAQFNTVLWGFGLASIVGILYAIKAKRLIDQSGGDLTGRVRVWLCLILGVVGVLIAALAFGLLIIFA